MKTFIILSLLTCLGACSTANHHDAPMRKPSSEPELLSHTLPVSDITSIIVLPGSTDCKKGAEIKITGRARMANPKAKSMYSYDCVTVAPYSVAINSPSLGLVNSFRGLHSMVFQGMPSSVDLTTEAELKKLNSENMDKIKTRFADIKSGCMGSSVILSLSEKGELMNVEGSAYFGKLRCDTLKALTYGSEAAVIYYTSAANTVKALPEQITEHAKQIASSADALQKQAREVAAQKLKDLGEAIQPN